MGWIPAFAGMTMVGHCWEMLRRAARVQRKAVLRGAGHRHCPPHLLRRCRHIDVRDAIG